MIGQEEAELLNAMLEDPTRRWRRAQEAELKYWIDKGHLYTQYDARFWKGALRHFELTFADMARFPGGVVVDVGCGPRGMVHFLDTDKLRIGLDPIRFAAGVGGACEDTGVHRIQGVGEQMPLATESADLVICYNALDHVARPDLVLQEIHRVLRKGGLLLLLVLSFPRFTVPLFPILSRVDVPHPHHWTHNGMKRLLLSSGFVTEFEGCAKRNDWPLGWLEALAPTNWKHVLSNWLHHKSAFRGRKK